MTKRKLNGYRGRLTPQQIAEGMNLAEQNAERLVRDAEQLLQKQSAATAMSLAILSIEEAGKASILRSMSVARTEAEIRELWKDYRSHTKKNVAWILLDLVRSGARKLDDLRPMFDPHSDHPEVLDQLKQLGFYTDCLGEAHWTYPEATCDEHLAKTLVRIAKVLAKRRSHTAEEIEIWIKHIGPVWKGEMAWMKQALINWHREMHSRGLVEGEADEMERFVREGVDFKSV